ncbi:hypothetical protein ACHAPU_006331 [Fusarium lateritium]
MTSNDERPVIAIVHGAWHRPSHYKAFAESLTKKGFTVLQPLNATSGNEEDIKGKTHLDDVEAIRKALQPDLDNGKRIVLVCHSYGGIPGSAAAEGYQVHEREGTGLSGGISHIVYITSFALPAKGLSLYSFIGNKHGPMVRRTDDVCYLNEKTKDIFYHDANPEVADKALSECVLQSTASLETPSDFVATDVAVPKTYVVCEIDRTIPVQGQLAMVDALGEGVFVKKVMSGHLPFLNEEVLPEIVDFVVEAAH